MLPSVKMYLLNGSLVKVGPVRHRSSHASDMDILEVFLLESPWPLVHILHFKATVGWDPLRLDWGYVDAGYFGGWVLISKIAGPY